MKLFGLTGGVGMGKSTSAAMLARWGIAVVDTDVIAREIVEPGQPALNEIAAAFGGELIGPHGKLQRSALAEIVFSSPERLKQLEAILHPLIRDQWLATINEWRREGKISGAVVIPLLFETDAQHHFDAIICVACSKETQAQRLRARGWTDPQIGKRIAAQWPVERKIAMSNHVVWTEGDLAVHEQQLARIVSEYIS